jgi:hypothetical protein
MGNDREGWKIGVDIGGTFTDIVLWNIAGDSISFDKVLTTPDDPSRAVLTGVERILASTGVSAEQLVSVIHGTTLVANALAASGVTTCSTWISRCRGRWSPDRDGWKSRSALPRTVLSTPPWNPGRSTR